MTDGREHDGRDHERLHLTDSGSIPTDSDIEVGDSPREASSPGVRQRWSDIGLVGFGGAVGTGLRAALAAALPPIDGISWAIFAINVVGAFCLGLLLESLSRRGPDHGRRRALRLLIGTGALGGFTTYSTLADDTARLMQDGRLGAGAASSLLTVAAGLAAVIAGLWAAELVRPRGRRKAEA